MSSPTREIRNNVYVPLTYYMKNDYSVARNKQGKQDKADPLTIAEADMVPNGFHLGSPYQDPSLRTEGSAPRDIAFVTERRCYLGTGSYIGMFAFNEEQFAPGNLYYKEAMELRLEPCIKDMHDFDI